MELVPSTTCHFAKGKMPAIYLEVYDPALKDKAKKDAPVVGVGFKIFDRKSEKQVYTSDTILLTDYVQPGNALVPLGFRLPVDNLQSGDYRIEIRGRDCRQSSFYAGSRFHNSVIGRENAREKLGKNT